MQASLDDILTAISDNIFEKYFKLPNCYLNKSILKYLEIINSKYKNTKNINKIILDFLLILYILVKLLCDYGLDLYAIRTIYEVETCINVDINYIKKKELEIYMKIWKEINYNEFF